MRLQLLLTLVVACAKQERVEVPTAAPGALQRRPHMVEEAAGCRRNQDSAGVSISAPLDPEAPIVVLDELHLHGRTPMSPRVAIWSDGDAIFAHGEGDDETLVTARLPKERAAAIARDVYTLLDDVPLFTDVYAASGGTLMRITVNVDGKWRSAAVHGDDTPIFSPSHMAPRHLRSRNQRRRPTLT